MNISDLKNRHAGKSAFCLGTAPHLNQLDLSLLRNHVTIGCNQLALVADEHKLDYICFLRGERLNPVLHALPELKHPHYIIPESLIAVHKGDVNFARVRERVCPVHTRFTTPEHTEYFSYDLVNCIYGIDSVATEIQLAVWMGCNPIYVLGVDAEYKDEKKPFYDESKEDPGVRDRNLKYSFPDLREWLKKVRINLWAKGIKLMNASGEHGSLRVLPRIRLGAAVGKPRIAVTSGTFSKDDYLVAELKRYFDEPLVNREARALAGDSLVEFLKDADGVILGTEHLDAYVIERLPCLRYVSKYGVGIDNIDFNAAKEHWVETTYKKGVNSDSVAELTLAFALMLLRCVDPSIQSYRAGKWKKLPGRELSEITLGIFGYGYVGKMVAEKFAALGVGRLLVNDLLDFPVSLPAEFVSKEYLLKESDMITMHVSMEKQNHHFVNDGFLGDMKPRSFLINTSRGEVVDEDSLVRALRSSRLAGAALDVYANEPEVNPVFRDCPNLLTTCHIAGSSNRAIKNMGWAAIEGLLKLMGVEPY